MNLEKVILGPVVSEKAELQQPAAGEELAGVGDIHVYADGLSGIHRCGSGISRLEFTCQAGEKIFGVNPSCPM